MSSTMASIRYGIAVKEQGRNGNARRLLRVFNKPSLNKHIKHVFPGIVIPKREQGNWMIIYYKHEAERFEISNLIRQIAKDHNLLIRIRQKHQTQVLPLEPEKTRQYSTFGGIEKATKLNQIISYLQKEGLCTKPPLRKVSANQNN